MEDLFDKNKIIECMFDPIMSEILAELENCGKESSYLAQKSNISENELKNKIAYLLKHDFLKEENKDGKIIYSANSEKLSKILENDENFDGAVDGLTKLDSYLN